MTDLQNKIISLKKEKGALVLAHYYQGREVREIADHVCDSFDMAMRAREAREQILVICGVRFMAESAKILNPDKTVLLPSPGVGCPMADMIAPDDVAELRAKHPGAAVVCYVNSSAAVKAVSDVCCTSSSAVKIVSALPSDRIIFIPDRNLGAYVASKVPSKEIILYDGCCPIHDRAGETDVLAARRTHPGARLLAHPECRDEVLRHADYIGSTSGIIKYALDSAESEFIIATEVEIADGLSKLAPGKSFFPLAAGFECADMKKTTPADVLNSLEHGEFVVTVDDEDNAAARKSLEQMVALG